MADTYADIWGRVLTLCPGAGPLLAQRWVTDAFRRISERRCWSWMVKYGQFILPDQYLTGTVDVVQNSTTVTGNGTAWDVSMVGRQFRLGTQTPIYTISQVNSGTSLELDNVYGGPTAAAQGYQIYLCYVTPPSDFRSFISLYDPRMNWQLYTDIHQTQLNYVDAQRANQGQVYLAASYDYTQNAIGRVQAPTQIIGSGPSPYVAGSASYTGVSDAIFTVQMTSGGASGVATFQWKKDAGTFTAATTDTSVIDLSFGVQIYFPQDTYVNGDTWVIRTYAQNQLGIPRFELWPHYRSNYVFPFLYWSVYPDIDQPGVVIPQFIRGDVIMELALVSAAQWPGPSADKPNPYYDLNMAQQKKANCEFMINELERQDNETYENMVSYAARMPFAPWFDSRFMQSHDF